MGLVQDGDRQYALQGQMASERRGLGGGGAHVPVLVASVAAGLLSKVCSDGT